MRAIISPHFNAIGPQQFLFRGCFVDHPDVSTRGDEILQGLIDAGCEIHTSEIDESILRESILKIHDANYYDYLRNAWVNWSTMPGANTEIFPNISPNRHTLKFSEHPVALAGWYIADCAAPIGQYTWRNALGSVSAALTATSHILDGELSVYALCRPSGHHACRDMAMGMCFFNNVAIAAVKLRQKFERIAILDIDMHHGNGTQQIFEQQNDVLTISIHGDPTNFYPFYMGFADENGLEEGENYNLNIPLPVGSNETTYLEVLQIAINRILSFNASALIVATGFDTYVHDNLGCFLLESSSYYRIGQMLRSLNLPTLFVQEGGYYVEALRRNVRELINGFQLL